MPSSDTWFKPGRSGNPKGRPPGRASMRDLVRRELQKTGRSGRSIGEEWAAKLLADAQESADMLNVLRWLEGSQPSQDNLAAERLAEAVEALEDQGRTRHAS